MNHPTQDGLTAAHGPTEALDRAFPQRITKAPGEQSSKATHERHLGQVGCGLEAGEAAKYGAHSRGGEKLESDMQEGEVVVSTTTQQRGAAQVCKTGPVRQAWAISTA